MELNEYQERAGHTDLMPGLLSYHVLGLTSEAGELAGKLKKIMRGDSDYNAYDFALELGDCLWYVASVASALGYDLETIARMNIEKLAARKENGALQGNGDNR